MPSMNLMKLDGYMTDGGIRKSVCKRKRNQSTGRKRAADHSGVVGCAVLRVGHAVGSLIGQDRQVAGRLLRSCALRGELASGR